MQQRFSEMQMVLIGRILVNYSNFSLYNKLCPVDLIKFSMNRTTLLKRMYSFPRCSCPYNPTRKQYQ